MKMGFKCTRCDFATSDRSVMAFHVAENHPERFADKLDQNWTEE